MKLSARLARRRAWTDIEVNSPLGQPVVNLSGKVKELIETMGLGPVALSITHTANFAMASAVALPLNAH
jgi:phosphopantetheinyl transferase (holo-ACP synthase)